MQGDRRLCQVVLYREQLDSFQEYVDLGPVKFPLQEQVVEDPPKDLISTMQKGMQIVSQSRLDVIQAKDTKKAPAESVISKDQIDISQVKNDKIVQQYNNEALKNQCQMAGPSLKEIANSNVNALTDNGFFLDLDQYWNNDAELQVKEMLLESTKKIHAQVANYTKALNHRDNRMSLFHSMSFAIAKVEKDDQDRASAVKHLQEDNLDSSFTNSDSEEENRDIIEDMFRDSGGPIHEKGGNKNSKANQEIEQRKMKQQKEMYQKNLQSLLRQKQLTEKNLMQEKAARMKAEESLQQIKSKVEFEIRTMRSRIEEEYRSTFQERYDMMCQRFQDESKQLQAQYQELRNLGQRKDTLIQRLSHAMCKQEDDIASLHTQLQCCYGLKPDADVSAKQKRQHIKLVTADMSLLYSIARVVKKEIILKSQQPGSEELLEELRAKEMADEKERDKYRAHIQFLEESIHTIHKNMNRWMFELTETKESLKMANEEIERLKIQHDLEIQKLTFERDCERDVLQSEINSLKERLNDYEEHVHGELAIQDEIQSRQQNYINLLRKEVMAAKTIIGNRQLRDQAISDLNFDKVFYYEYKPKTKEEGRYGEDFDKQKVKIVAVTKNEPIVNHHKALIQNQKEIHIPLSQSVVLSPKMKSSLAFNKDLQGIEAKDQNRVFQRQIRRSQQNTVQENRQKTDSKVVKDDIISSSGEQQQKQQQRHPRKARNATSFSLKFNNDKDINNFRPNTSNAIAFQQQSITSGEPTLNMRRLLSATKDERQHPDLQISTGASTNAYQFLSHQQINQSRPMSQTTQMAVKKTVKRYETINESQRNTITPLSNQGHELSPLLMPRMRPKDRGQIQSFCNQTLQSLSENLNPNDSNVVSQPISENESNRNCEKLQSTQARSFKKVTMISPISQQVATPSENQNAYQVESIHIKSFKFGKPLTDDNIEQSTQVNYMWPKKSQALRLSQNVSTCLPRQSLAFANHQPEEKAQIAGGGFVATQSKTSEVQKRNLSQGNGLKGKALSINSPIARAVLLNKF